MVDVASIDFGSNELFGCLVDFKSFRVNLSSWWDTVAIQAARYCVGQLYASLIWFCLVVRTQVK